jgi:hypothetical protein
MEAVSEVSEIWLLRNWRISRLVSELKCEKNNVGMGFTRRERGRIL